MNIDTERFSVFLRSIKRTEDPFLLELRKTALLMDVPIVRDEMAGLLEFLVKLSSPKSVLEVGSAVGYSAILMAKSMPEAGKLIGIEHDEERCMLARDNIIKSGMSEKIEICHGDAGELLRRFSAPFDFIFMDAAKAQYITWLPDVLRLLKPGGILVTDNVLQEGDILESRFAVTRRNRTIHSRMREYLDRLMNTQGITTAIVNVGDGAALTVKEQ